MGLVRASLTKLIWQHCANAVFEASKKDHDSRYSGLACQIRSLGRWYKSLKCIAFLQAKICSRAQSTLIRLVSCRAVLDVRFKRVATSLEPWFRRPCVVHCWKAAPLDVSGETYVPTETHAHALLFGVCTQSRLTIRSISFDLLRPATVAAIVIKNMCQD